MFINCSGFGSLFVFISFFLEYKEADSHPEIVRMLVRIRDGALLLYEYRSHPGVRTDADLRLGKPHFAKKCETIFASLCKIFLNNNR